MTERQADIILWVSIAKNDDVAYCSCCWWVASSPARWRNQYLICVWCMVMQWWATGGYVVGCYATGRCSRRLRCWWCWRNRMKWKCWLWSADYFNKRISMLVHLVGSFFVGANHESGHHKWKPVKHSSRFFLVFICKYGFRLYTRRNRKLFFF